MDIKVELLKRELIRKINEELDDFEIDATQIAAPTLLKIRTRLAYGARRVYF